MAKPKYQPIYDITKTFEENLAAGPNPVFKATKKTPKLAKKYTVLGHEVGSPFGSAACPTGTDSHYIKRMFENGYDIVTTKTRRSIHYNPHPVPNVVHIIPGRLSKNDNFQTLPDRTTTSESAYKTLTIANSFGNNSLDPQYWLPDATKANNYAQEKGKLLITSVVGTIQEGFTAEDYYQDFATVTLLAKQAGAQAIEINFSCPNVYNEGVLCYDPLAVAAVARLAKHVAGDTPLIAKIGYFPQDQQLLLEEVILAAEPYVSAISAINTFAAPIYDESGNQALPGRGRLRAGLSGHAIKDLGLDMVERLAAARQKNKYKYEIIGVGGVLTPKNFKEYHKAGADVVMSATGAMWNPDLAAEIKQSLA